MIKHFYRPTERLNRPEVSTIARESSRLFQSGWWPLNHDDRNYLALTGAPTRSGVDNVAFPDGGFCRSFDADADNINYGTAPLGDVSSGTSIITFSFWLRVTDVSNRATGGRIVSRWNTTAADRRFIISQHDGDGDTMIFAVQGTTAGALEARLATARIVANRWDHWIWLFAATNTIYCWQNGELVSLTPYVSTGVSAINTSATCDFKIGQDHSSANSFYGQIADLKMWYRALTTGEIQQLVEPSFKWQGYVGYKPRQWWHLAGLFTKAATESVSLNITEAKTLEGFLSRTDDTTVSLTEASAMSVVLARADDVTVTATDAAQTIQSTLTRADNTIVSLTETPTLLGSMTVADNLGLSITEVMQQLLALLARQDDVMMSLTESTQIAVTLTRTDSLGSAVGESLTGSVTMDNVNDLLSVAINETAFVDTGSGGPVAGDLVGWEKYRFKVSREKWGK